MTPTRRFKISYLIILFLMASCVTKSHKVFNKSELTGGQSGMNIYPDASPGETIPLERPYFNAPPLIPHSIKEFDINRSVNDCLDCHLEGYEVDEGHIATKVPPSHLVNEYNGERKSDQVTEMRYNCRQCHVPQAIVKFLENEAGRD